MEIRRADLIASIGRVLPAVAKKEVFEQASKVAFRNGCVIAYNDEISITDRLEGVRDIEGAIDGKHLHSLLGKMTAETVELTATDSKLNLRSGRVKATFDLLPVLLPLGEIDLAGAEMPLPANFVQALKLISGTCARDMSRPVLTCVYMSDEVLEASDGFRAARLHIDGVDFPNVLLPVTAAEVVIDYPVDYMSVSDSAEWMCFTSNGGNTAIFARIATGKYPDLSGLYDFDGTEVVLPAAPLSAAIERASIFTKRDHVIDEVVNLSLRPNQITISAGYDGGNFSEVVRFDQRLTADFSIHPDFLSEVLKTGTNCVVGDGRVKFTGPSWEHMIALRD